MFDDVSLGVENSTDEDIVLVVSCDIKDELYLAHFMQEVFDSGTSLSDHLVHISNGLLCQTKKMIMFRIKYGLIWFQNCRTDAIFLSSRLQQVVTNKLHHLGSCLNESTYQFQVRLARESQHRARSLPLLFTSYRQHGLFPFTSILPRWLASARLPLA